MSSGLHHELQVDVVRRHLACLILKVSVLWSDPDFSELGTFSSALGPCCKDFRKDFQIEFGFTKNKSYAWRVKVPVHRFENLSLF